MAVAKVQPGEQHAVVNGSEVINNGRENHQVINNGSNSKEVITNGGSQKANESVRPKSLYVGDLESNVSDAQIQELFQQVGPVVSVRICRDAMTKTSLGYGYVNYSTAEDATEALRSLNFTLLNGKPIRIMYSHRDPTIRKCGSANIFIKNLHKAVDNQTLYHKFSVFGPILSSKIATDASGQSKGYGFVHFEQDEAAQDAIKCMNGTLINDSHIYVGPFMKKEEREQIKLAKKKDGEQMKKEPEPEQESEEQTNGKGKFKNVFVNNLSESMNNEDLRKYFDEYGTIISAVVMRDAAGKSKCFGFVNFENVDDAAKCVESLNGKKIDGKEWYVGKALKKSELRQQSGTNLYLKHLDDSIDDNKLRELFSIYGTITSCKIMRDFYGHSKGFGFVSFSSPDHASRALVEMNKKVVLGKPLYVALAQQKDERRAKLQSHFSQLPNPVGMESTVVALSQPKDERRAKLQSHFSQLPNPVGMESTAFAHVPMCNPECPILSLYVVLAQQKKERGAKLQSHFSQQNEEREKLQFHFSQQTEEKREKLQCHFSELPNPIDMEPTARAHVPMYNPKGPTSYHPIGILPAPKGHTLSHPIGMVPPPERPVLSHPIDMIPPAFSRGRSYGLNQPMFDVPMSNRGSSPS